MKQKKGAVLAIERDQVLAIYDRLIAEHKGLTRKGKTTAYTAINGNMFSFVDPSSELCLRLDKDDIALFGQTYANDPVIRYNSVMRGYVGVDDVLLFDETELSKWFARSVEFAKTLKPKPSKSKPSKSKTLKSKPGKNK